MYVAGLSSGAAVALDAACKAPDVFAGVAALAGPSPGSDQGQALAEADRIPARNVPNALGACRAMAGNKASAFATQIAIVAAGAMDLNGPDERYRYQALLPNDRTAHAGRLALVSFRWSQDNAKVVQQLYGADPLGGAEPVQGDFGVQRIARTNGKPRVSYLVVNKVGHAWPAGTGRTNAPPEDGLWIAQSGLNFPDYILSWLIANNQRAQPTVGPVVTVQAVARARQVIGTGSAKNRDGSTPSVTTALLNAGSNQVVDSHGDIALTKDGDFSDTYANVGDGSYRLQVTARDNAGDATIGLSNGVTVGQPPPPPAQCFTDNNYNHVAGGRVQLCSNGFACAKGAGDNLGLYNVFVTSSVVETSPGFYRKGTCAGSLKRKRSHP